MELDWDAIHKDETVLLFIELLNAEHDKETPNEQSEDDLHKALGRYVMNNYIVWGEEK